MSSDLKTALNYGYVHSAMGSNATVACTKYRLSSQYSELNARVLAH